MSAEPSKLARLLPDAHRKAALSLRKTVGRSICSVMIAINPDSNDLDIAVDAIDLDQDDLVMMLSGVLNNIAAGNTTTTLRENGEVVARYEGKTS